MFSSFWSTIQLHRYLLVFRAFLNAPYSHICHNYNAKHKIIVLTLAWGRLRCPRRSGQETCYPFHLVLKIFVFFTNDSWQPPGEVWPRDRLPSGLNIFRVPPPWENLYCGWRWYDLNKCRLQACIYTGRPGWNFHNIKIHSHSSLSSFFCKQPCTHYSSYSPPWSWWSWILCEHSWREIHPVKRRESSVSQGWPHHAVATAQVQDADDDDDEKDQIILGLSLSSDYLHFFGFHGTHFSDFQILPFKVLQIGP